jgi:RNA polymerase sigma-70 factor (ECF subfamily)
MRKADPADEPPPTMEVGDALAVHFERLYGAVHRFLSHRVFDAELADELTARTFYKAAVSRRRVDGGYRGAQAWVLRIAMNVANTHLRRRRLWRSLLGRLAGSKPHTWELESGANGERAARVRAALLAISSRSQTVVVLRYYLDMSHDDIAKVVGCRPDAARARLSRALKELRAQLGLRQTLDADQPS